MEVIKKNLYWVAVVGVGILSLFFSYYGVMVHHYVIAPGDDTYVHLRNIIAIAQHGAPAFGTSYPPGFYWLVLGVSKLTHSGILPAYTYTAPILLPLSGLVIWWLAETLYGRTVALVVYGLYALVSLQPLQTYYDGTLPNITAASILMPLAFTFFIKTLPSPHLTVRKRLSWLALGLLTSALIFYTHHLTVLVFVGVMAPWAALLAILYARRAHRPLVLVGAVVGVLAAASLTIWAFFTLSLFGPARGVVLEFATFTNQFPYFHPLKGSGVSQWTLGAISGLIGGVILRCGLAGLVVILARLRSFPKRMRLGTILILLWLLLYLVGSHYQWSGEPTRLARDMAMPLSILAGWFIVEFVGWLRRYSIVAQAIAIILILGMSLAVAHLRAKQEMDYSPMVRFSQSDQVAYDYLLDHHLTSETTILTDEPIWEQVVAARGQQGTFVHIHDSLDSSVVPSTACYLTGWYLPGVWPASYADHATADVYLNDPTYTVEATFTDPIKVNYLICKL
ncbi:MAG: hypothetical protein WCO52_05415 [bacterium]